MKKALFVFAIVAASLAANAQVGFGIKAGGNLANLKASGDGISVTYDSRFGIHGGLFANIPASTNFRVQPELLISMEGAEFDEEELGLTYLNVPVLAQYVSSGFYGETGPQVGFLMSAKAQESGEPEVDIKDEMETINFSWAVGAGYRLASGLGFGARYTIGLSNISKEDVNDDFTLKSNVLQFTISYTFGTKSSK